MLRKRSGTQYVTLPNWPEWCNENPDSNSTIDLLSWESRTFGIIGIMTSLKPNHCSPQLIAIIFYFTYYFNLKNHFHIFIFNCVIWLWFACLNFMNALSFAVCILSSLLLSFPLILLSFSYLVSLSLFPISLSLCFLTIVLFSFHNFKLHLLYDTFAPIAQLIGTEIPHCTLLFPIWWCFKTPGLPRPGSQFPSCLPSRSIDLFPFASHPHPALWSARELPWAAEPFLGQPWVYLTRMHCIAHTFFVLSFYRKLDYPQMIFPNAG